MMKGNEKPHFNATTIRYNAHAVAYNVTLSAAGDAVTYRSFVAWDVFPEDRDRYETERVVVVNPVRIVLLVFLPPAAQRCPNTASPGWGPPVGTTGYV